MTEDPIEAAYAEIRRLAAENAERPVPDESASATVWEAEAIREAVFHDAQAALWEKIVTAAYADDSVALVWHDAAKRALMFEINEANRWRVIALGFRDGWANQRRLADHRANRECVVCYPDACMLDH